MVLAELCTFHLHSFVYIQNVWPSHDKATVISFESKLKALALKTQVTGWSQQTSELCLGCAFRKVDGNTPFSHYVSFSASKFITNLDLYHKKEALEGCLAMEIAVWCSSLSSYWSWYPYNILIKKSHGMPCGHGVFEKLVRVPGNNWYLVMMQKVNWKLLDFDRPCQSFVGPHDRTAFYLPNRTWNPNKFIYLWEVLYSKIKCVPIRTYALWSAGTHSCFLCLQICFQYPCLCRFSYPVLEPLSNESIKSVVVGPGHLAFLLGDGRVCRAAYSLLSDNSLAAWSAKSDKPAGSRSSHPSGAEEGGAKVSRAVPASDSRPPRSRTLSLGSGMLLVLISFL